MTKELLEVVALDIQAERRRRNNQLLQAVNGETEIYNLEDLMRGVGSLNYAYNIVAALKRKWDDELYKSLLIQLAYSVVLLAEVDGNASAVLDIIDKSRYAQSETDISAEEYKKVIKYYEDFKNSLQYLKNRV